MEDLIVNYNLSRNGLQLVTFILTSFDVKDTVMVQVKDGSSIVTAAIPECYAHLIGNPEFIN
jgi:hypothetical protein